MTTDELKAAAEYIPPIKIGAQTGVRRNMCITSHEDVWDVLTKLEQHHKTLADWVLQRLTVEPQQYEYIATLERERDEARSMYLAIYGRVGLVLTLIGEGDKFPDKPEWRKGDA